MHSSLAKQDAGVPLQVLALLAAPCELLAGGPAHGWLPDALRLCATGHKTDRSED